MLQIREVKDKKHWDTFLEKKDIVFYPFFQSWKWGEVQKRLGRTVWRLGVYNGKQIVAICQIVDIKARRGHYLHLRHGPVLLPFDKNVFEEIISCASDLAKKEGVFFIRMSPVVPKEHIDYAMLRERGFRDAPIHNMDAEVCWVLDITKSEDELLKQMRKTHRYLIRKAQSMEIKVVRTNKSSYINDFLSLYSALSHRKHFVPHRGVKEEFEEFSKDDEELLFLAYYNGKVISGALIAYVGQMAIYRHGASDARYRDIPASYLLQWEAIREAKKREKTLYNFWGIAPIDNPNHPWQGLTLFKTGFGGKKLELLHAQDLPLSPLYWKTYAIERLTTWLKGY
ncbi:MAG: peptidoglycan bridge formation glycyltransferase FemA/FemB family protein [Candidatus Levybacteria bacterium]|nr:peptidoglycan bridge formation glycyltransferase FemA/FemB family protein [Candidatus Levybacteria bacterium]